MKGLFGVFPASAKFATVKENGYVLPDLPIKIIRKRKRVSFAEKYLFKYFLSLGSRTLSSDLLK